ncbi:Peroxisomal membrane protein PMP47B like [Verticillium longisporum]|nr:Peroxisomal membrane protein PMP47B like [Verticillium longisporum]
MQHHLVADLELVLRHRRRRRRRRRSSSSLWAVGHADDAVLLRHPLDEPAGLAHDVAEAGLRVRLLGDGHGAGVDEDLVALGIHAAHLGHEAQGLAEEKVKEGDEEAQMEKKKKAKTPSTLGVLLALLKHEGPQALFAGVIPALVLVINPILQYTLFEQMKNSVEKKRRVTPTIAFFLGALGKLFATSVTYPYITVKSQMHVAAHGEKKEGVFQAINRVVKEEGYKGLYKGIGPKVTQSVLTAALLFAFKDVLYEQTVKLRLAAAKKRA